MEPNLPSPRPARPRPWCAFALLPLLGLAACGSGKTDRPSALLITLDTTRSDALACFGGVPGTTPHLDGLAEQGVAYDGAHTVAPLTSPAHASMLTGMYPLRHSLQDNDVWALPGEVSTLAERAQEGGVQTGAIIASLVMHERFGLDQGFEDYDRPELDKTTARHGYDERSATEIVDAAILWLEERDPSKPFFLWVHFFDPHAPYDPPSTFRDGLYAGSPYHGEVAYMDSQIGRLLGELEQKEILDETFVAVVGDHGEGLGQHGEGGHGALVYETTLRVPFLLRYPDGYQAGTRSDALVSVVDIFPTMLDALELPPATDIDGLSLFRKEVPADRGIYFETYAGYLGFGYSPVVGWMDARGKYLHSTRPELYVLSKDPTEITNLAPEQPEMVAEYLAKLGALDAKPKLARVTGTGMDQEVVGALQDLGYTALGGFSTTFPALSAFEELGLPSPAIAMEIHEATLRGIEFFDDRRLAEAEAVLTEVLTVIDESPCALYYLSLSRINQGKHEEAIEPLQRLVGMRPELGFAHYYLCICFLARGDFQSSWTELEAALRIEPDNLEYMARAVAVLNQLGRVPEALAFDRRVQQLDPEGKFKGFND